MSPIRITARRTVGFARNAYMTALMFGVFLASAAALFAFHLDASEGGSLSAAVVWASSVAPILPILAAFLGMDVWSDERRSGRLDVMLASPVSELDLTFGKFVGTWILTLIATGLSLISAVSLLRFFAPSCTLEVLPFVTAFVALAMQGALWCAIAVAASAAFRCSAVAACVTIILTVALPRALWAGLMAWSSKGRSAFGEMPLDAHAIDFASGIISCGTVVSYIVLTAVALFVAVLFVELGRLVGRGAARARFLTYVSSFLSAVFATLLVLLAMRLDTTFDLPVAGSAHYSERTLGILADVRGDITVTCFLSRSDKRFRPISRFLRTLARATSAVGGARLSMRFVDPSWDMGEASRLVRAGVKPGSIVLTYGRRTATLPIDESFGERVCVSSLLRLTMPPQRRMVRWTHGHGETAFDDYGAFGMSDVARELARGGYLNQTIDFSGDAPIPSDCALVVVAGARDDFSRAEVARLDAYLKQGGRLLVLMNNAEEGGVSALLPSWGVKVVPMAAAAKTISGSDAIVSDFTDHPVTLPLRGSRIVLEKPMAFTPSAAVETTRTADCIEFTPLAKSGSDVVAAVVERGVGTGDDLDFRPTRIVVVGDSTFAMNAQLAMQAYANRDFFLNAVAYLAGTDAMTSGGAEGGLLVTGMDRHARRQLVFVGAVFVPLAVTLIMALIAFRRRRRE